MKKDIEEKITMEVSKSEAMFILDDRLENKWYVELEPILILTPITGVAVLLYEYIPGLKEGYKWLALAPIMVAGFWLLAWRMRIRLNKARQLYEDLKAK